MTQEHIVFGAMLVEIRQMLEKVREIGIDVTKLEKRVNDVEQKVNEEIEAVHQQYDSQEKLNNLMKEGFFGNIYQKGISQLTVIQNYLLMEFDIYSKIAGKYKYILSGFDSVSKDNITAFVNDIRKLLNDINNAPNMDYSMEKTLVENIYLLTYQVMKKEIQLMGNSTLLAVLTDSDITYIERCLLKEIKDLSFKSSSDIARKLKEIESNGLNVDYLQEDFLKLLWSNKKDKEVNYKEETSSTMVNKINNTIAKFEATQVEAFTEAEDKIKKQVKLIDKISHKIKKEKAKILKNRLFLAGYVSAFLGIGVSGVLLFRESFKEKHYYTKEEVYQEDGEITEEFYYAPEDDKVVIEKINPYEKLGFWDSLPDDVDSDDKFFREIESYEVSDIEFENLADYLTLDLESLGVEKNDDYKEYKVYLTPEDTYQEPYTLVKRITSDLENYEVVIEEAGLYACSVLLFFGEILFYETVFSESRKKFKNRIKLGKKEKSELIKELNKEKEKLVELQENLLELKQQAKRYRKPTKTLKKYK